MVKILKKSIFGNTSGAGGLLDPQNREKTGILREFLRGRGFSHVTFELKKLD